MFISNIIDSSDQNYYSYLQKRNDSVPPKAVRYYFITITTRKRFQSKQEFEAALTRVLFATNYPSDLCGYIEYSQNTSYHFHGIVTHKYNHFGKKSGWFSLVKQIDNLTAVQRYISKTRNHNI